MTPTYEETLRQWLDEETGGTMPREVREAGLAVLAELSKQRAELFRLLHHPERERDEARAEVGRLQGEVLKWTALYKTERQFREQAEAELARLRAGGIIMPSESSTAKMLDHWKGRAEQAEARLAKVPKAPETVFNILAGTGDGDGDE